MNPRTILTVAGLAILFAASVAVRITASAVPEISNSIPYKAYYRSLNYADAAENVLSGRGYVVNQDRVSRATRAWNKSADRLPPKPSDFQLEPGDTFKALVDEQGYLQLQIGLAKLAGGFHWSSVLQLQAVLSGIAALLVFFLARRFTLGWMAWFLAFVYAFHPLEIALSVTPDLPIWSVYASMIAAAIAVTEWKFGSWIDWVLLIFAGAFLGFCVVVRGPTLGVVIVALAGTLLVSARAHWFAALLVSLGCLLSVSGINALDSDVPTVGRSATYQTLLGGLSEFGHIEDLKWEDSAIHDYIQARHNVELYTPQFNEAARTEYLNLIQERPELLIVVPARRLSQFIVAYRPGKSSVGLVLLFSTFKVLAILSLVTWWRQTRDARDRRRIIAYLAVASATVFIHVLIVPLLEVYIASFFVLWSLPIAGLVAYNVCRGIRIRTLDELKE